MNARDAWEEAVRKERAMEIMDLYTFETDEDGIIRIYKQGRTYQICSADYTIYPANHLTPGCDCPDFVRRGKPCKHMIAAELRRDREAAQIAEYGANEALYA